MRTRLLQQLLAAAWSMVCLCAPARAVDETELKAAIVFNILIFVDWPTEAMPSAGEALHLCVGPSTAAGPAFKALHKRPLRAFVLEVRELTAAADARACHAVFVEAADRARLAASLKAQRAAGAIVISDDPESPVDTTAIVLRRTGTRIAFEVNMPAVRQAGVQLSSKLLRLAKAVRE